MITVAARAEIGSWPGVSVFSGLLGFAWADGEGVNRLPTSATREPRLSLHPGARGPRRRHRIFSSAVEISAIGGYVCVG